MWLPLMIYLAEMCVVTLGTLRIIFVSRGQKYLAPVLGFFEVFIWLCAISQIMQNLSSWTCFLAFALGFMTGNFLGILIEQILAMGMVNVRIITNRDAGDLVENLRGRNFGVTCVKGQGTLGPVQIVMTVIRRRYLQHVVSLIEKFDPRAFYAIDDLQSVSMEYKSQTTEGRDEKFGMLLKLFRTFGKPEMIEPEPSPVQRAG